MLPPTHGTNRRPPTLRPNYVTGAGDITVAEGGGGLQILDTRRPGIWARITGRVAGNQYNFARINDGDGGAFGDLAGATEVSTAGDIKCWEVAGRTDVPTGARVRLHPNLTGPGYTFAYQTPAATSADCSGLANVTDASTCVLVTVVKVEGDCASMDASQEVVLSKPSGADAATAWSGTIALPGGVAAAVGMIQGQDGPLLQVVLPGGAGTANGVRLGCENGKLLYAFPNWLCGGGGSSLGARGSCAGGLVLGVACSCCSILHGYDGKGWYCVRPTVGGGAGSPAHLDDSDKCDPTIVIVSGPYVDEAAAAAACGPVDTGCASPGAAAVPRTLYAHFAGALAALGTVPLSYNGATWDATFAPVDVGGGCLASYVQLMNNSCNWGLQVNHRDGSGTLLSYWLWTQFPGAVPSSWSPFAVQPLNSTGGVNPDTPGSTCSASHAGATVTVDEAP